MTGSRDKNATFTGLEALAEMARRIKTISGAVEEMMDKDGSETVKSFTIETGKGPINGVFGMSLKSLKDMPSARSAPRGPRQSTSRQDGEHPTPSRLVDVFDEADAVLVLIDAQGESDLKLGCEINGRDLVLFHSATKATFQRIELPGSFEGHGAEISVTNGIVTVRIAKSSSPAAL